MATMLKDSPANRILIRLIITLFQLYGPFCLGFVAWSLLALRYPSVAFGYDDFLNSTLLWTICAPEAAFYIFFIWYKQYIQRAAVHPPKRTKDERLQLFNKVRSEIYDPASFLGGWFRGSPAEDIGREELRRFVDWAFWEGRAGEYEAEKCGDEEEIEEYIQKIEKMMPEPFLEGKGKAKSLRLTLDPIVIEARSLGWYMLMLVVDTLALAVLKMKGWEYHRRHFMGALKVFPPRPAALWTKKVSVVPDFSYFLREHTSKSRLPVVYIHGIGIGILPSIRLLEQLDHTLNDGHDEDDKVGIIAVEVLQISSRLTTAIPRRAEFVAQLTTVINHHFGEGRFVLTAHSYGSILSTHVLRDPRLSVRVSGTLLIDPVSILLHMPDVAYNFTVRNPVRANEWMLWYFASKDPQIAHTLGRHFFWSENCLWRDQIDYLIENHGMRLTASLASDDLIVNTTAVKAYLSDGNLPDPALVKDEAGGKRIESQPTEDVPPTNENTWTGKGLETLWFEGYDHATVFDKHEDRQKLVDILVEYCRGS